MQSRTRQFSTLRFYEVGMRGQLFFSSFKLKKKTGKKLSSSASQKVRDRRTDDGIEFLDCRLSRYNEFALWITFFLLGNRRMFVNLLWRWRRKKEKSRRWKSTNSRTVNFRYSQFEWLIARLRREWGAMKEIRQVGYDWQCSLFIYFDCHDHSCEDVATWAKHSC